MTTILLISLFLIVCTAFCASSEAAVFSVNKIKIQTLVDKGHRGAKTLQTIKQHIGNSIGTLTLLNTVFAVGGGILVGGLIKDLEHRDALSGWELIVAHHYEIIFTFFLLLFGEVIPKNAGEKFALAWAITVAPIIRGLIIAFAPILWLFKKISNMIIGSNQNIESASEEEIIAMTDLGLEANNIEKDESELIQNVFTMNDKTAKNIMTPRVQIEALDKDKTLNQQKEEIFSSAHSRLPVFGEDLDDVIGFVLLRDCLEAMAKDNGNIKPDSPELLNTMIAVKETMKVDNLLSMFRDKQIHIAIVVDEFGGTSGLVSLEDVLEQLVGQIVDETDEVEFMRDIQNNGNQVVEEMEVEEVSEVTAN